jgi:Response regulator receiver domain
MMPGEDGLSLCRRLRAAGTMPIIMLTAIGTEMDRVVGLEMGADDYLSKPFSARELLARVLAVLRRSAMPAPGSPARTGRIFGFAGWRLDVTRRQLYSPAGALVDLRAAEFDLLLALVERPSHVLTSCSTWRGDGLRSIRSQHRRAYQPTAASDRSRSQRAETDQDRAHRWVCLCRACDIERSGLVRGWRGGSVATTIALTVVFAMGLGFAFSKWSPPCGAPSPTWSTTRSSTGRAPPSA